MEIPLKIPLKELLSVVCTGAYSQRQLQELYRLVYTIARRLVRRKLFAPVQGFDLLGLSEADITHDCIIELFTLGKSNELTEFCKYFSYQRISPGDAEEETLLVHLRRLVFTIVNDNIFRLYNEADPALGRILRNLKIALGNQNTFKLINRFDELVLELVECNPLPFCRMIDEEYLQTEIFEIMATESEIPVILGRFGSSLLQQDVFQRNVPLLPLALAIKKGFEHVNIRDAEAVPPLHEKILRSEVEREIENVCNELKNEMHPRYVGKAKCSAEMFGVYMNVIRRSLLSEFIDGTDGQISYYDHFRECSPGMMKQDYLHNHRAIVEYLGKVSKKRTRERIKQILSDG